MKFELQICMLRCGLEVLTCDTFYRLLFQWNMSYPTRPRPVGSAVSTLPIMRLPLFVR